MEYKSIPRSTHKRQRKRSLSQSGDDRYRGSRRASASGGWSEELHEEADMLKINWRALVDSRVDDDQRITLKKTASWSGGLLLRFEHQLLGGGAYDFIGAFQTHAVYSSDGVLNQQWKASDSSKGTATCRVSERDGLSIERRTLNSQLWNRNPGRKIMKDISNPEGVNREKWRLESRGKQVASYDYLTNMSMIYFHLIICVRPWFAERTNETLWRDFFNKILQSQIELANRFSPRMIIYGKHRNT